MVPLQANSSWWFQPIWKILISQNGNLPQLVSGENKKYLKPPTSNYSSENERSIVSVERAHSIRKHRGQGLHQFFSQAETSETSFFWEPTYSTMLEWGKVFGDSNFPRLRFPTKKRSFNAESTFLCHVFLIRSLQYHKVPITFERSVFTDSDSNVPFCANLEFCQWFTKKYTPTTYGVSYSATPSEHPNCSKEFLTS